MRIVEPIESVKHEFFEVTLIIARAGSAAHVAQTKIEGDKIREREGRDELTDEEYGEAYAHAMAGTCLVGWENFVLDGAPVPFTIENARSLLVDDNYALEFVLRHAMNQSQFMAKASEDSKKKLSQVSGGN